MSLKDIIAAKKAKLLQLQTSVIETKIEVPAPVETKGIIAEVTVAEPPIVIAAKPLTFAEKLAAKRAAEAAAKAPVIVPKEEVKARVFDLPDAPIKAEATKEIAKVPPLAFMQKLIPATIAQADDEDLAREEYRSAPKDIQDGYRDIKSRVHALANYDDAALEEPMSQLKKALLANPNACMLMLDEDIGKMTIALRRLVQESLVEVVKEKKAGKNTKTLQIPLTAEQMQNVFDEL